MGVHFAQSDTPSTRFSSTTTLGRGCSVRRGVGWSARDETNYGERGIMAPISSSVPVSVVRPCEAPSQWAVKIMNTNNSVDKKGTPN
uniref:Uncharacterized protein n=1 Tax=Timema douglasi TaxID=61478 RepID=A0A7R8VQH3_TIMDO|nr:unnamed protein product [Timema douglasi]